MIKISKGYNIPISGEPADKIEDLTDECSAKGKVFGITGIDYRGLKFALQVKPKDKVKIGQPVFVAKNNDNIVFCSPVSGEIKEITRGPKRILATVQIISDGKFEQFKKYPTCKFEDIDNLSKDVVKETLLNSGLWSGMRERPFSNIADPDSDPSSIMVTAMNSAPLAEDVNQIIQLNKEAFIAGIKIISKLSKVYVCSYPDVINEIDLSKCQNTELATFYGKHPCGLVGTHIYHLDPIKMGQDKKVYYLNYQEVIAWGKLFLDGKLYTDRIISLAGPMVKYPRHIKVKQGIDLLSLVGNKLKKGKSRIISGDVLAGRHVFKSVPFLGRYVNQVSVIREGITKQKFLWWFFPHLDEYSPYLRVQLSNIFSCIMRKNRYDVDTGMYGGRRAIISLGQFEKVFPFKVEPSMFLRSIMVGDYSTALSLGILNFDEEDMAILSYIDFGKNEYADALRNCLDIIQREVL